MIYQPFTVKCKECGKDVIKEKKEVIRSIKLGRKFFCNNSCGAVYANRSKKSDEILIKCEKCVNVFKSTTGARSAKQFCSRGCASAGSVTDYRREKAIETGKMNSENLLTVEDMMKKREAFKYELMLVVLKEHKIDHEFEYRLGEYIFDLAIFDSEILVEFDEEYHNFKNQKISDDKKQKFAESKGFTVIRIETEKHETIPASYISDIVELVLSERKAAQRARDKKITQSLVEIEPFIENW